MEKIRYQVLTGCYLSAFTQGFNLRALLIIQIISNEFIMSVAPAKAGVQNCSKYLDSRFRGNDARDWSFVPIQDY